MLRKLLQLQNKAIRIINFKTSDHQKHKFFGIHLIESQPVSFWNTLQNQVNIDLLQPRIVSQNQRHPNKIVF